MVALHTKFSRSNPKSITTGTHNIAIGHDAGTLTTGTHNAAIGNASCVVTTGNHNAAIGNDVWPITTGNDNAAVGRLLSKILSPESKNVYLKVLPKFHSTDFPAGTAGTPNLRKLIHYLPLFSLNLSITAVPAVPLLKFPTPFIVGFIRPNPLWHRLLESP